MGDAQHEGPRPIGQTAGSGAQGTPGFEKARVNLGRHSLTEYCAESAAHDVGAFALRKMNLIQGAEVETEPVELECNHNVGGEANGLLLYNGKAFDSCFPLRTDLRGGCVSPFRSPLFSLGRVSDSVQVQQ